MQLNCKNSTQKALKSPLGDAESKKISGEGHCTLLDPSPSGDRPRRLVLIASIFFPLFLALVLAIAFRLSVQDTAKVNYYTSLIEVVYALSTSTGAKFNDLE